MPGEGRHRSPGWTAAGMSTAKVRMTAFLIANVPVDSWLCHREDILCFLMWMSPVSLPA